ncbi:MAG: HEAT repeat domain-containing protein [Rhodanobacteraceae bacterium]|nr:HEAT repeat domain-containing protein [Rhodanobacteraceae bacterium]
MKPLLRSCFALWFLLVADQAVAAVDLPPAAPEPARALYRQGHAALDRQDWLGAVQRFRALEAELARSRSPGRDAALYWQAYALDRSGDRAGAVGLSQKLLADFPDSVWADDANELLGSDGGGDSEADRSMALDALMLSTPEQAVPILVRVLAGEHSDRLKKRALFILVQISPKDAAAAIETILAGNGSPALKREAIQTLALAGDPDVIPRLIDYYGREPDAALKRAVIDAGLVGGHAELVLAIARSERDAELQSHAIRALGAMGQSAKVVELLPQLTDVDAQRSAIDALAIAGNGEALAQLVRGSSSAALRLHAIRALSIVPAERSVPLLIALYREQRDPALRRALLHALGSSGDDAALKAIGETLE